MDRPPSIFQRRLTGIPSLPDDAGKRGCPSHHFATSQSVRVWLRCRQNVKQIRLLSVDVPVVGVPGPERRAVPGHVAADRAPTYQRTTLHDGVLRGCGDGGAAVDAGIGAVYGHVLSEHTVNIADHGIHNGRTCCLNNTVAVDVGTNYGAIAVDASSCDSTTLDEAVAIQAIYSGDTCCLHGSIAG